LVGGQDAFLVRREFRELFDRFLNASLGQRVRTCSYPINGFKTWYTSTTNLLEAGVLGFFRLRVSIHPGKNSMNAFATAGEQPDRFDRG